MGDSGQSRLRFRLRLQANGLTPTPVKTPFYFGAYKSVQINLYYNKCLIPIKKSNQYIRIQSV